MKTTTFIVEIQVRNKSLEVGQKITSSVLKVPQQLSACEIVLGMTVAIQTLTEMFLAFVQGREELITNQVPICIKEHVYFLSSHGKPWFQTLI